MLAELVDAVVGVDTHRDTHQVEIALPSGVPLATCSITNDTRGYAELLAFIVEHSPGPRLAVSIEGTRSYGGDGDGDTADTDRELARGALGEHPLTSLARRRLPATPAAPRPCATTRSAAWPSPCARPPERSRPTGPSYRPSSTSWPPD